MERAQQFEHMGSPQRDWAHGRWSSATNGMMAKARFQSDQFVIFDRAGAVPPAIARPQSTVQKNGRSGNYGRYLDDRPTLSAFAASMRPREPQTAPADKPVVYIVDGEAATRASLETLIRLAGWHCEPFASAREFLATPKTLQGGCVVADIDLPDLTGLDLQKRLSDGLWKIPIVFVTRHPDVRVAVEAMKRGAVDFLTKPCGDDVLLTALEDALERGRQLSRDAGMAQEMCARWATLSRREHEVMALVVTGLLNKQIGFELGISEITVKAHRGQVMRKMGAKSLAGLVTMAGQMGLATAVSS